jgi:methionine aminopeptidase
MTFTQEDYNKYNTAAGICGGVYRTLVEMIQIGKERDVLALHRLGMNLLRHELDGVYRKERAKWIAYPVSISINDCVGEYIYEKDKNDYNTIYGGDIVKIELGVNIAGAIARYGETFIASHTSEHDSEDVASHSDVSSDTSHTSHTSHTSDTSHTSADTDDSHTSRTDDSHTSSEDDSEDDVSDDDSDDTCGMTPLDLLDDIASRIRQVLVPGGVNDDVKMTVESQLTEHGYFPVENTMSWAHLEGQMNTDDSKYILLNQRKYYDEEGEEVSAPNLCFDFEEGDVFTVVLRIVKDMADDTLHEYVEPHAGHIARFNEYHHDLKTKTAREFLANAKGKNSTNAFNLLEYTDDVRARFGIKECTDGGILDTYPVKYVKSGDVVYHKIFTVLLTKKGCYVLKY